ncbi:MAG: GTPase ObgE [Pseudomonadales bacterium]|jgi:GTP-binding protein|nr:GTPase ObgE [Pseudomonadales bacterium]
MLDLVFLRLQAGDGGNGRVNFLRNRHILKGGPDGGDGGSGGNIIIRGDKTINTLQHFSGEKEFRADDGQNGGPQRKIGKKSPDIVLKLPLGTTVWLLDENETSWKRRQRYGVSGLIKKEESGREKYYLEKESGAAPPREQDEVAPPERVKFSDYLNNKIESDDSQYSPTQEGKLLSLVQITEDGQEIVLCQGGFGGLGNDHYKSSRNTTPLEAQYGSFGEEKLVFFELRSLANVGLVGFPNAGKSTLLSVLTKASPKVADYPFTTLEPHLGVMTASDGRDLVIADIPGLIEGASEGRGLGFNFLRHVENCKVLLFVLSLTLEQLADEKLTDRQKAQALKAQYLQLEEELTEYNQLIKDKERLIAINKSDLYSDEFVQEVKKEFADVKTEVLIISAGTRQGLQELQNKLLSLNTF